MFTFIEHIRKLTIKSLYLLKIRLSNPISIPPFQGWNTLGVFFLTIDVPIEVSGFALTSPTKLLTYKSCCFRTSALVSLLKVSNFDLSLLLPVGFAFAFAWVLFFLRIFLLISGVIHGTEETERLVFDGMCLSAESWRKDVIRSKFSCTERVSEWPLKYISFANSNESFLIDSKSPFWYRYTFLRGFFMGGGGGAGMITFKVSETISWSLNLSGEWSEREVCIQSNVVFFLCFFFFFFFFVAFFFRVGKCTSCSKPSPDPPSVWLDFFLFFDVRLTNVEGVVKWENRIEQNRHPNVGGVIPNHDQS